MLHEITHVFLDGARIGEQISVGLELNADHDSLYRGGPEQKLVSVTPYFCRFQHKSPFAAWFMERGWGDSWGILFKTAYGLPDLYKHFRKFLKVSTEDGRQLYFRFYDPRVLRVFLANCEPPQVRDFFGPIEYFLLEDADPSFVLKFTQDRGVLSTRRLKLSDIYQPPAKPTTFETESNDGMVEELTAPPQPEPPSDIDQPGPVNVRSVKNSKWNMFD